MFAPTVPIWEIVLRTCVVYVTVFALLRVAGKRELGQMSVADLVVILVIANAVQNSLNGGDVSLTGGLVAAATLVALNVLLDRFGRRIPFFSRFVVDEPTLLLQDGEPILEHCEREGVSVEEIAMSAREHGIGDLADVSAAILEPDGSISIIPKEGGKMHRSQRRIRQLRQRP
ncbi:MAG TPA: YetF domain-containing protein [Candidatus Limnocylindria bacterium]|nr:YetF domain-containing protein [Candidatus Limnocylindria bacterium]